MMGRLVRAGRSYRRATVILVGTTSTWGTTGLSIAFDMLVSHLKELGLRHIVVDRGAAADTSSIGAFRLSRAIKSAFVVTEFLRVLRRGGTTYITISSSLMGFLRDALMIWPAWLLRHRVILHLHGAGYGLFYDDSPRWVRWMIRQTLARADRIIILSDLFRAQFGFLRDPGSTLAVVPNGPPLEAPTQMEVRRLPSGSTPLRVLFLSNMMRSKGYMDVLEACKILVHDIGRNISCDFCGAFLHSAVEGEGKSAEEARNEFSQRIEGWNLNGAVAFHGVVDGEQKRRLLQEAHVLVLPTYHPWEGQPISIIEALAFGLPVISTAHNGIKELVLHNYNGIVVNARAPDEIADAIDRLNNSPELYEQLAQNARRHYEENFTSEAHLAKMMHILAPASQCA